MLPELQTNRLHLRELRIQDGPAMEAFQNRPEQWQYQAVEPEEFVDGTLRIKRYLEHRGPPEEQRILAFAAFMKTSSELIGQVSLSRSSPKVASLGVGVAPEHTGQGLASEMVRRLLAFGFEEFGLHRVEADVAVENKPCISLLEGLSMKHEGTLRECIWAQGRWWTEMKYSILEQELFSQE